MRFVHCLILVLITFEFSYGMSSFTKASVKFTLNFFRKAYKLEPSKNCVISPIAIQRSLAILHHVARDDVSRKMETLLGLPNNHSQQIDLNNPNSLEMITKVFHSQMELNPDLLQELQAEYDSVEALDFDYPHDVARAVTNWTALATNGLVDNVFSTQDLANDANLIMINTINLNAPWKTPHSTTWRSFKYIDGAQNVSMIRLTDDYRFAEINDLQVLEVAFKNDTDLSMLIIKSKFRSLENIIKKFSLKTYQLIDKRLSNSSLGWDIPKFSIDTKLEAKRILDALGLSSIFSEDAFEVYADTASRLANVYQVLRFGIDENGTRGTAAYSRQVVYHSMAPTPPPAPSLYAVDGPFMFLVRKNSSKDIIFIGHYSSR